jgi:putative tryptophan/tyrosine transport system substrate-binding protein
MFKPMKANAPSSKAMRRRDFVAGIAGMTVAWPLAVRAQQGKRMQRVGLLSPYSETDGEARIQLAEFRDALHQLGWQEDGNVRVDARWAGGNGGRIRVLAKELIAFQPDVIVSRTTPVTAVLREETRTIPIVFVSVSDPVGAGFVASMARPGGNVTGFTNVEASLGGKWLELLKQLTSNLTRVAVLFGRKTSPDGGAYYLRLVEESAALIAVKVIPLPVEDGAGIDHAIGDFAREPAGGVIVTPDPTTTVHRNRIIEMTASHQVPAIYPFRYVVAEGGLISYGVDITDLYRRAAGYVDRILRGDKPTDLPVQAPVKFELAINSRTAKALGLTVPLTLLATADEVIK